MRWWHDHNSVGIITIVVGMFMIMVCMSMIALSVFMHSVGTITI